MTQRLPSDNRRRDLAAIHCAAKELGLERDAYEAMLYSVARVRSAADLDHAGRRQVLDHLRACGWRPRRSGRPGDSKGAISPGQLALIRHLWQALGEAGVLRAPGDAGLRAFVRRQTRRQAGGVSAPEFLTAATARDVIEHLKRWAAREQVTWQQQEETTA